jgi:multidrug transporter EmrE-like cation transporter
MNWIFFIVLSILAYVSISLIGYFTQGESLTVIEAMRKLFTFKPFLAMIIGNTLWVAAVYYGFLEMSFAIPATIAIGVVTSFFFSIFAYGTTVTLTHIAGIVCIIFGIYLLK